MEFQIAQRKRAKIKMAIQGHSGSGKTYSALLVAHGLSQSWEKVVYKPLITWTYLLKWLCNNCSF